MTTSLHDRLADLAADAPPGGPAPDLWDRGRRYHRRRRVGAVVIAAVVVVLLGALGTATWQRSSSPPVPVGPSDGLRLPDRFYTPSSHLPGTDDEGPLGPLVAVVGAARDGWLGGTSNGLVGVSGATGEYRFLDLADRVGEEAPALSAGGRRLAYWYGAGGRVDGVAVYDTVTGDVQRLPIDSDHGLMADRLLWVGDRLWIQVWRYDGADRTSSDGRTSVRWDPATGVHREVRRSGTVDAILSGRVSDGGVVSGAGRTLRVWGLPPSGPGRRLRTDAPVNPGALLSPDRGRIVAIEDPDAAGVSSDAPGRVVVLTVAGPGRRHATVVPGRKANELLGWRDRTHVVTLSYPTGAYWSVDVRTGERERLSRSDPEYWGPGTLVARDAWAAPTYHAPAPPDPLSPLLVGALAVGTLLLGAGALVLWRRRVRP